MALNFYEYNNDNKFIHSKLFSRNNFLEKVIKELLINYSIVCLMITTFLIYILLIHCHKLEYNTD